MWTVPLPEGRHASQGRWSAIDGEGLADGEGDGDGEGLADGEGDGDGDGEGDGVGVAVSAGVGVADTLGDEVAAPAPQPATAAVSNRLVSAPRRCWGRPRRARIEAWTHRGSQISYDRAERLIEPQGLPAYGAGAAATTSS